MIHVSFMLDKDDKFNTFNANVERVTHTEVSQACQTKHLRICFNLHHAVQKLLPCFGRKKTTWIDNLKTKTVIDEHVLKVPDKVAAKGVEKF